MYHRRQIKTALISVTDRSGLDKLVSILDKYNISIIATDGTYAFLKNELGYKGRIIKVSDYINFPEILNGRVKTLHPKIHGGILATDNAIQELASYDIHKIDLVIANLYKFEEALDKAYNDVANESDRDDDNNNNQDYNDYHNNRHNDRKMLEDGLVEYIDIGGVTLIRAAAKNFREVAILSNPNDYQEFISEMEEYDGELSYDFRKSLALKAFSLTSGYDNKISKWLQSELEGDEIRTEKSESNKSEEMAKLSIALPEQIYIKADLLSKLKYGENSHQAAGLYIWENSRTSKISKTSSTSKIDINTISESNIQGVDIIGNTVNNAANFSDIFEIKNELSYNNLLDAKNAYNIISEFPESKIATIIKHGNPCGVAIADDIKQAYLKTLSCDSLSAFGSVIALNDYVDIELAKILKELFIELLIVKGFKPGAEEILKEKKRPPKLLIFKQLLYKEASSKIEIRSLTYNALLIQTPNMKNKDDMEMELVTGDRSINNMSNDIKENLKFAFMVAKHVSSNAIVFTADYMTIGIGAGQMSRIDATKIASQKAEEFMNLNGKKDYIIMASDAFLPFADNVEQAYQFGVSAIIQPGGSIRDKEVIAKAEEYGITMIFTHCRNFRH